MCRWIERSLLEALVSYHSCAVRVRQVAFTAQHPDARQAGPLLRRATRRVVSAHTAPKYAYLSEPA